MDWEAIAAIAAIAVAIGTAVAVVWRGGTMVGRYEADKRAQADRHAATQAAIEKLTARVDDHDEELAEGGKTFAGIKATLDLVVGQTARIEGKIDRLAEKKDH